MGSVICLCITGGKKAVSPKQEVGGAVGGVSLCQSGEAGEKELRGAAGDALEPSLCPREGPSTIDSKYISSSLVTNHCCALLSCLTWGCDDLF